MAIGNAWLAALQKLGMADHTAVSRPITPRALYAGYPQIAPPPITKSCKNCKWMTDWDRHAGAHGGGAGEFAKCLNPKIANTFMKIPCFCGTHKTHDDLCSDKYNWWEPAPTQNAVTQGVSNGLSGQNAQTQNCNPASVGNQSAAGGIGQAQQAAQGSGGMYRADTIATHDPASQRTQYHVEVRTTSASKILVLRTPYTIDASGDFRVSEQDYVKHGNLPWPSDWRYISYGVDAYGPYRLFIHVIMGTIQFMTTSSVTSHAYPRIDAPSIKTVPNEGVEFGEVLGYRMWRLKDGHLQSMSASVVWIPGVPMDGYPTETNDMGIHAFKEPERGRSYSDTAGSIVYAYGEVMLWGEIYEHDLGFRSQYARVSKIIGLLGGNLSNAERMNELRAIREFYGVGETKQV